MTGHAHHHRHSKDRQHVGKGQRAGGQQQVQNQRRHDHVDSGDQQLAQQVPASWGRHPELAPGNRPAPVRHRSQRDHGHQKSRNRNQTQRLGSDVHKHLQGGGMHRHRAQTDQRRSDAKRHRRKSGNRCNIIGIHPQRRINAIAHGPAGHHAQPDGVAQRIAQKPAQRDRTGRGGLADIPQRRPVVTDQRNITRRGRGQRTGDQVRWRGLQLRQHHPHVQRSQQMIQCIDPRNEQQTRQDQRPVLAQQRAQTVACVRFRCRGSIGVLGHGLICFPGPVSMLCL